MLLWSGCIQHTGEITVWAVHSTQHVIGAGTGVKWDCQVPIPLSRIGTIECAVENVATFAMEAAVVVFVVVLIKL